MTSEFGVVAVTTGRLAVGRDGISIRSTPRLWLRAQFVQLRHGSPMDRAHATLRLFGLLAAPVLLGWGLYRVIEVGPTLSVLVPLFSLVTLAHTVWTGHLHERTIPRTAIDRVELDRDRGVVTITHEPRSSRWQRLLRMLDGRTDDDRYRLRSTEDVDELGSLLDLAGIDLADAADVDAGTSLRYETQNGACFCGDCGRQVSPNDRRCPTCGYALRIDRGTLPL